MLFTSVTFLYWFLPIVLALYFIAPARNGSMRVRNLVLLAASLVFYAWGEPIYILLLAAESLLGWLCGLGIERYRGGALSKAALTASVIAGIGALLLFKYADFFTWNMNRLFSGSIEPLRIAMPIGISFFTFQILSYTIDLYRGSARVQRDFLSFWTYVALFPQLVAGPIVRYISVEDVLHVRGHSLAGFAYGARRFSFGLAKKILLANTFGELASHATGAAGTLAAWLYLCAFALQIYFDFSGYSDMAIGLGHIFGFRFPENFRYPYAAGSVTEFWRRWHISLSSWFRDYVYIPLGGNRVSVPRHLFNILFVWFLTGFWHGAGWNFIVWGLYYALLLLLEKYLLLRVLGRLPAVCRHLWLILCTLVGWAFFDAASLPTALETIRSALGAGAAEGAGFVSADALYYLRSYAVPLAIGVLCSTPMPMHLLRRLASTHWGTRLRVFAEPVGIAALLLVSTAWLVDGSFNPFIYFRF
jgi:alginate O-acetyltransferase complex protein AlgI